MYYIGCDQHKHYSVLVIKDENGTTIDQSKLYHSQRDTIMNYFSPFAHNSTLALEASGFEPWLADLLQEMGMNVKLVHPLKTRAIAEERIKTDKLSANVLADLLRLNLISEAHLAPPEIREMRYYFRYRLSLVQLRTLTKNKVHSLLGRLGILVPSLTDLFGKKGRLFLQTLTLEELYQKALHSYLHTIDVLNNHIKHIESDIRRFVKHDTSLQLLTSMPGIGTILASCIMAEISTIDRFRSSAKLASYVGIVPSLHQSGQVLYSGHITKQGNKYLRWAFVEAAHGAIRQNPYLAKFYQKIRMKKGSHVAIVAVARKLVTYAYHILKKQKPYNEIIITGRS